MPLKFHAVTKTEAAKVTGGGEKTSAMRTEVGKLAREVSEFFAENPDKDAIFMEYDSETPENSRGVAWMDLDEELQNVLKREKGGGMSAIVSNIRRNFQDELGIRAVLRNPGQSPESGDILFYRHTPKQKNS